MSDGSFEEHEDTESGGFHVVGVGASAGGLESLERLFSRLPPTTGMAFVVLQHLSPDFKSLMDELLARRTQMPVRLAEDEMPVEANNVYLLPPMKEMVIRDRRLLLSDRDPRHGLAMPIDHFFRSLALDLGDRAIAVVLSGSGSDGSRGIKDVRRFGGVVFSESPDTAAFNGMPLSAMATGAVDQVLAPEEIADAIARLGRPDARPPRPDADGAGLDDEDASVTAVLRLLRDEYGIDFSHYKASTVTRRIERRLALNRSLDLSSYIETLRGDSRELNSLYEDLLIGVTRFFRDDSSFRTLEDRIIPDIIDRQPAAEPDHPIRIWVAGCATGQEAYSIAMILHEQLAARERPVNLKILATDVHKSSLEVASAGIYSKEQLGGVSQERLERFFTLKPSGYQISQTLRESIVFAPHNLIRDAPFTKLDLITLPQSADLLPAARPEDRADALPLRAEDRRLPLSGLEREPGRPGRRIRHARRARQDLSQAARRRAPARFEAAAAARQRPAAPERHGPQPHGRRQIRSSWPCTTGCSIDSCRQASSSTSTDSSSTRSAAPRAS